MKTMFVLLALAIVIAVIIFAKMKSGGDGEKAGKKYKAKRLLSPTELEFLNRLEQAVPELRFHAQVAMGAIVDSNTSRQDDGKEFMRLRGTFSQKIIDFVAQDRATGDIVAIVELDDKTHNAEKDAARDSITADAGYKTVRWHVKNKPDASEIRSKLLALSKGNVALPPNP